MADESNCVNVHQVLIRRSDPDETWLREENACENFVVNDR